MVPGDVGRQGLGSGCWATCVCRSFQAAQPLPELLAKEGLSEPFCRALENWLGPGGWGEGKPGELACWGPQRQEHKFFSLKQS